jgi:hypothetical protein
LQSLLTFYKGSRVTVDLSEQDPAYLRMVMTNRIDDSFSRAGLYFKVGVFVITGLAAEGGNPSCPAVEENIQLIFPFTGPGTILYPLEI